jgi:16S rRNA (uracil1498-N3)-methyltransferase
VIRVAVPVIDRNAQTIPLPPAESHHLRVRRVTEGEAVEALDGRGLIAEGILHVDGKEWEIAVDRIRSTPEPIALSVLVGAGDRERFAWLVEKATELGATEIVPLVTDRTGGVGSGLREEHREKLARRAVEALKQCGGSWLPRIHPSTTLADAIAATRPPVRWLADPSGKRPREIPAGEPAAVIIGPEGGFTDRERDRVLAGGFEPIRLGARTLRFETAAVAALALLVSSRKDADG